MAFGSGYVPRDIEAYIATEHLAGTPDESIRLQFTGSSSDTSMQHGFIAYKLFKKA
jgi:hypothetical protein